MLTMNQIMAKMIRSFGMKVLESSVEDHSVMAEMEGFRLYFGYVLNDEDGSGISNHKVRADVSGADRVIIWHLGPLGRETRSSAREMNIEIWDREKVIRELGKAVLNSALPSISPGSSVSVVSGFEELFDPDGQRKDGVQEAILLEIQHESPAAATEVRYVKPAIGLEEIKDRVGNKLHGYEFILQYIPYFLFGYEVRLVERKGERDKKVTGKMAVNAMDRNHLEWDEEGLEYVRKIGDDMTVHVPDMEQEEAAIVAGRAVLDVNVRSEETATVKENSVIYEMTSWKPAEDSLSIWPRGTVYRPAWGVAGREGLMVVDAVDGRIIREDRHENA